MRASVYERLRPPPLLFDVLLVGALGLAELVVGQGLSVAEQLLSLTLIAALVLRRLLPVACFTAVSTLCLAQLVVLDVPVLGDVALLVALVALAQHGPRWARWGGLATGLLGSVLGPLDWFGQGWTHLASRPDLYPLLLLAVTVAACWVYGDLRRTRANYVTELEERAVRLAVERDQQASIAAAAERARIAREMHDVVAHSLSVMVVQADGGRYAAQQDPELARRALATVAATGREALTEMRRLLGLLRSDEPPAQREPQPGTDQLEALVTTVRSSGLPVALQVSGTPTRVDDGTGLTLYRIVQEGLTNTLKHGGPRATARVRLTYGERTVEVSVIDDGRGAAASTSAEPGHGLVGIRERVELHGGTVVAGPASGGGFEIRATLPLVSRARHQPQHPNQRQPEPA